MAKSGRSAGARAGIPMRSLLYLAVSEVPDEADSCPQIWAARVACTSYRPRLSSVAYVAHATDLTSRWRLLCRLKVPLPPYLADLLPRQLVNFDAWWAGRPGSASGEYSTDDSPLLFTRKQEHLPLP
jgi:hypothetical protein